MLLGILRWVYSITLLAALIRSGNRTSGCRYTAVKNSNGVLPELRTHDGSSTMSGTFDVPSPSAPSALIASIV
jgi:hypothetical protein